MTHPPDLRLSDDAESFRKEVRTFLEEAMAEAAAHCDPQDLTGLSESFERRVQAAAGSRGWVGGLDPQWRFVFECEVARADAPLVDTAITLAGHPITTFGSAAMQEWLVPKMQAGEVEMCIAYTEEDAGNDLSAMKAHAEPAGNGGWALTGRKVLVTGAHKADWCVTVARTSTEGPIRKGLTMFLVDLRAPGVRVSRRPTMNGWTLSDIDFEGVVVGSDAVIGSVNEGWRQMNSAVAAERTGTFWLGFAQRMLELMVEHVRTEFRGTRPLRDDPIARDTLARCAVEAADAERLCRRALWSATTPGQEDHAISSMVKITLTELLQTLARAATELAGEAGLVWASPFGESPPGAAGGGRFAWEYLERVHGTISVGSNELQRDLVATLGLGLPRQGTPAPAPAPPAPPTPPAARDAADAADAPSEPADTGLPDDDPDQSLGGSIRDLVQVARKRGRAAAPSRFHSAVLARLLGWDGPPAAVALHPVPPDLPSGAVPHVWVADYVHDASGAEVLLVRTGTRELTVVTIDNVTTEPQPTIDDDRCVRATFTLGPAAQRMQGDIEGALARAAIVRCADAVGAAEAALDAVVERVKERRLFGSALGSYQAVQHRCTDMLMDVTIARDAVFEAAAAVDRGASEHELLLAASYAKATATERCRRVTASAHQLAGGQGIDAAAPFHRWYRRAKAIEPVLGDTREHRERIAESLLS